ncbi:diguanylate cyclase [Bacillus luteolus]|uniref:Diguanylate cyclase n=1 Tax=Litchfieldia luteola TaxID=682179 RepID=A0ABR9QGB4_9BACI|nr:diguanylate cyclase [Cytobacillus luteolus]MBE4907533.1 diguanylate cyclase [Cytobacillus luteolus]MBP1944302.1 diguanylate cyclase (GGDEF)-like protein [Cytobacillus luteolus]
MSVNLRTYFILIFIIFIAVFTAILSSTVSKETSKSVEKEISNSLTEKAFQLSYQLDHFMWSRYGEVTLLSKLETFQKSDNVERISQLLNELKANIPAYSWIGFTDENGIVKAATDDILVGKDISERPVYTEATKETFVGDVHEAVLLAKLLPNPTGEPIKFVDISSPVVNDNGEFVGVLAAHLSWQWAKEVEQAVIEPIQKEGDDQLDVFIISKNNNTVLLGPKEMVGQQLQLKAITKAQSGENNWTIETWPDDSKYLTGYAFSDGFLQYPGLEWTVLVRQPEKIAFKSVEETRDKIILLGLLFLVVFSLIGWVLAGVISNPIRKLVNSSERLRDGERVEVPIIRGIKDIETLSVSLRDLVTTLTKTESNLDKMESMALLDSLTGLPNRLALDQYIDRLLESKRSPSQVVVFYLDLDGFKIVNDTYGHHHGDLLLREVAQRLKNSVQNKEAVFRLGGDEFVVLLELNNKEESDNIGNRIIQTLNSPIKIEGNSVQIGCSIGAAMWPNDDKDLNQVLRQADNALYQSKQNGKNQLSYFGA